MSFNRTIGTLEKCSEGDQLYIDDILNIIVKDLFNDIKDSRGVTMDALPVHSETDFIIAINNLTKIVRRTFFNNQSFLTDERKAARWEEENRKITEYTDKVDALIEEIQELNEKQNKAKGTLQQYLTKKDAAEKEWNIKAAELAELEGEIALYSEQIQESDRKARETEIQIDRLKEDIQSAEDKVLSLEKEREKEKARKLEIEEEVNNAFTLLDTANTERISESNKLDTIRQKLDEEAADRNRIREEAAKLENQKKALADEIDSLRNRKVQTDIDNTAFRQMIEEFKEGIETSERKFREQQSVLREYRNDFINSKIKLNTFVSNYRKTVEKYQEEQNYYGDIISGFMDERYMMEEWSFATADEELQRSLETRKKELDNLFREEITILTKFLSNYDID